MLNVKTIYAYTTSELDKEVNLFLEKYIGEHLRFRDPIFKFSCNNQGFSVMIIYKTSKIWEEEHGIK